jgi:acetyl esterase/lipase
MFFVRSGSGAGRVRSLFVSLLISAASVSAQTAIPLWTGFAPGAKGTADADRPTITPFPAAHPNGAALVIFPGGGYGFLATETEGSRPAKWFNNLGITCFVVKYRLGPAYHHPVEMWDGQRAVRWVRANAVKYGIDPARVGVLGFSAGGHMASTVSTHYDSGNPSAADTVDRQPSRPDWSILAYPVITMDASFTHSGSRSNLLGDNPTQKMVDSLSNEKQVTSKTPPAFLFHAKDDAAVPVKNSQAYHDSLVKRGVAAELKLYEKGGHGFGLADGQAGVPNDPVLATWPGLAGTWMDKLGFFKKTTAVREGRPAEPGIPGAGAARGGTVRTGILFEAAGFGSADAMGRTR